ncbi:chordin-like protein 1 isoform X1 [Oculina patagonica]
MTIGKTRKGNTRLLNMSVIFKAGLIFLLALLVSYSESRTVGKGAVERRSAKCNANNREYSDGEDIIYHTVTSPIGDSQCKNCKCSAGSITDCRSYACHPINIKYPEACDNWIWKVNECCPICEACENNASPWAKRISQDECYECSCSGGSVQCNSVVCYNCPGITESVPGKCCPKCIPTTTTEAPFTIQLTTERPPPVFPFPFGKKKRDVTALDKQFDGEEYDETEQ